MRIRRKLAKLVWCLAWLCCAGVAVLAVYLDWQAGALMFGACWLDNILRAVRRW